MKSFLHYGFTFSVLLISWDRDINMLHSTKNETKGFVTFTKEILNRKLHFCVVVGVYMNMDKLQLEKFSPIKLILGEIFLNMPSLICSMEV